MTSYERFRAQFAEALDPLYHPIEWVDLALYTGRLTGFFGRESALLAEIKTFPGGARTGSVFHALGDRAELENEIRPRAEAWAKANGAIEIVIEGRRGWVRALSRHGYRHEKTAVAKGL